MKPKPPTLAETREATRTLTAILDAIDRGELDAPARVVARLEGAVSGLAASTGNLDLDRLAA